jgi:hypothetical protein
MARARVDDDRRDGAPDHRVVKSPNRREGPIGTSRQEIDPLASSEADAGGPVLEWGPRKGGHSGGESKSVHPLGQGQGMVGKRAPPSHGGEVKDQSGGARRFHKRADPNTGPWGSQGRVGFFDVDLGFARPIEWGDRSWHPTYRKRRSMRGSLTTLVGLIAGCFAAVAGAVPNHIETRLTDPAGRGIGPLTTIEIVSRWDSAGYRLSIDPKDLDLCPCGEPAVFDSGNGSYRISYTTGAMQGLRDSSGIVIPVTATSRSDPSSTFTYRGFKVCRNTATPVPVLVGNETDNGDLLFKAGEQLWIHSRWRVAGVRGFRLTADYRSMVPDFTASEVKVDSIDTVDGVTEYILKYKIPGKIRLVPEANGIPLTIVGADDLCSEIRDSSVRIDLRTSSLPAPIEQTVLEPVDRGVRNGDTVRISSIWDSTTVTVRGDFTALDRGLGSQTSVPLGNGGFEILYTPGPMDALEDAVVRIPITGTNALGDTFSVRTLTIARNLRTPPPRLLEPPHIESERTKIHPTDELIIVSRWESPDSLPFSVEPLLTNLVPGFKATDAEVSERAEGEFVIVYRVPAKEHLAPDGRNIRIGVMARDTLNSVVRSENLVVELDTQPPAEPPVFDILPGETNENHIIVAGTAPDAYRVAIVKDNVLRSYVEVDTLTDRFSFDAELTPGINKIGGWSEDDVGNKTVTAASQIVRCIADRSTVYSTPFRPKDEIQVNDAGGMREATVTIFNLEGDAVVQLQKTGSFFEARLTWDGRDADGQSAQPGYYLMRVHRVSPDGHASDEVLPMLFRHD